MFLRQRRVGGRVYIEALESYRDGGKPKHRCAARWVAGRTLSEAIAEAAAWTAKYRGRVDYYDGVRAGTVQPRFLKHRRHAAEYAAENRRKLTLWSAKLATLEAFAWEHPEFRERPVYQS